MKKIPVISIFFFVFLISTTLYTQDFNLFNPSSEIYLFSAYDEGANAFRYNPAVLGLGHRLNAAVNMFFKNNAWQNKTVLAEIDALVNSGSFGFSYRFAKTDDPSSPDYRTKNTYLHTVSAGFGIGNKTFSGGLLLEWLNSEQLSNASTFDSDKSRFRAGLGFLFRPFNMISAAVTLKTKSTVTAEKTPSGQFTFGVAGRPFVKDILTAMLDFGFVPYSNRGFFENHVVKLGVDFKPVKGFHIFGNFTRFSSGTTNDYVNLGIRFDLPNFSARYTNSFNKFTDRDNSFTSYKSAGQQISLSYNLEKRESVIKPKKELFELTLSGSLQDYNTEDVFFGILGKGKRSVHEVIADIDYAAHDNGVSGMLLKIYPLSGGMIINVNAAVEELTNALERFKKTGKKITAYLAEDPGPREYYIATFADKIVMPEEAMMFYGLNIEVINFKQFLEKYGIELQNFYAGKYKLTFQGVLDSTTSEGKETINRMLDVVYGKMLERITRGRGIAIDDYLKMKLSQPLVGKEAKRLGLVDENGWSADAEETAKKQAGTTRTIASVNRSLWDDQWSEPGEIAIIGVYSSITTGESEAPDPIRLPIPFLGAGRSTGSETVIRQLEDAFSNPKVKVVILRVDSGGGSAVGSAEINAAIIRLKKKYNKPFLVSMGGAAASGGYEVSVSADKIFCDELTITGSIGVWAAIPNLDSLLQQQKIKVESFKRGENSDMGTFTRKLTEQEVEIVQGIVDFYYEQFISEVTRNRKLTREEAEEIAQGRVWLGTDAFDKRLVDEIGGLYETVKYAKQVGKLGNRYKLVYYAVPGGNTIDQIVTASVAEYLQKNFTRLLGLDDDCGLPEIKY